MPFELRPYPTPTLEPKGEYLQRAWRESVLPLAERFGVFMKLPEVSPQPHTHLAFEGYQYAKQYGKGNEYNHSIFSAFFQKGENIGDINVLTRLAKEIGLNQDEFRQALRERKYRESHQLALKHAYEEARITAVPTFFIGTRRLQGLHPAESLKIIIEEELSKLNSDKIPEGFSCEINGNC